VLLEPKSGGARPTQNFSGANGAPSLSRWTGAPTFKFVPVPLEGDAFWDAQTVKADEHSGNVFWE